MDNPERHPKTERRSPKPPLMTNRRAAGASAEDAAEAMLLGRGWSLAARNWRCRTGEIDLVCREGDTLVFVEVRSRKAPSRYGTAVEAVTPRKCRQVRATAEVYLRMNGLSGCRVRFDVVAVTFGIDGAAQEMKHIPGAF